MRRTAAYFATASCETRSKFQTIEELHEGFASHQDDAFYFEIIPAHKLNNTAILRNPDEGIGRSLRMRGNYSQASNLSHT